jgi:arginine decarboxylase
LNARTLETWNIGKSEDLYAIRNWGKGYFSINRRGHVCVHPDKAADRMIDLKELIDDLCRQEIRPPVLLRFPQVLRHRLGELHRAFADAITENGYRGRYRCVYPIKVNQERHVVEEIFRFGQEYGYGLEAGSKPELLAVLALADDNSTPIICNGFKDASYLELVVLAQKLGKIVIPVIENATELKLLVDCAARHQVRPAIGIRMKLVARGSGRWESSTGFGSKFGLTIAELLAALDFLSQRRLADRLKLLHFHLGSQVTNIRSIKEAVNEAARIYVELSRAGAGLEMLDIGGGLGIDYDGSQTNFGSSVNYTLGEYARDVVFGIQNVCDHAGVAHPTIVSESGRAIAAYYSVLVFDVVGVSEAVDGSAPTRPERRLPHPITCLFDTLADLSAKNLLEMYHDAVQYRDDALDLFNLGHLSLAEWSLAEKVFWMICREVQKTARRMQYVHEDLEILDPMLADTYYCNFSVFQSMPDSWAVEQLFPVMPIHRLGERPERSGTLADLTCDSDGKIDRFIDPRDVKRVLELHAPNGQDYFLGAFLVGAYQEILGDLHNLFGNTHAVHVNLGADGQPVIQTMIRGESARQVLEFVQFSGEELFSRLRQQVECARAESRVSADEAEQLVRFYGSALDGYTYLEKRGHH